MLAPLAATDLTAAPSCQLHATDASLARGASCSTPVSSETATLLWQNGDCRGAYSRLQPAPSALLKAAGIEGADVDGDERAATSPASSVPFLVDVLEIGCGSGWFGGPGPQEGLDLGPLLALTASRRYDVLNPSLTDWIASVVSEGLIRSLLISPACRACDPRS